MTHVSALEKEIRQAQISPFPVAVPINVTANAAPVSVPATTTRASRANKQTKIPTPAKKRTRANSSGDEGNMTTTLTTSTSTTTTAGNIALSPITMENTNNNNNNNNSTTTLAAILAQLTAMNSMIASLKSEIDTFRKENADLKHQLVQSANKIASLEQTISLPTKRVLSTALEQHEENNFDDNCSMSSSSDLQDQFLLTTTTNDTNNLKLSSGSQWAHPLNLEKLHDDRKKIDRKKQKDNKKLYAKLNLKSSPSKKEETSQNQFRSAVRALTAPSSSSELNAGFSYVYYPSKSRTSRNTQRKNLVALGVTNGRVLDIHYPGRNVVAILVHNDYKAELVQKLETANVHQLVDFSPLDPSTIKDPQYNHLDVADRTKLAIQKHNERLIRALPHIRDHLCRAIALSCKIRVQKYLNY